MTNVVPLKIHKGYVRKERTSVASCLRNAKKAQASAILILGYDSDGALFIIGRPPDPGNALWLMETAKAYLIRGGRSE